MRSEWKTSLKKESIVWNIATLTSLIHQRVITWRPNAFDRSHPQCPIKIISQGTLPATKPVLKGAGCPTILFISTITTVVYEVTGLPRSVAQTVITRQRVWRTGACGKKKVHNYCHSKPLWLPDNISLSNLKPESYKGGSSSGKTFVSCVSYCQFRKSVWRLAIGMTHCRKCGWLSLDVFKRVRQRLRSTFMVNLKANDDMIT